MSIGFVLIESIGINNNSNITNTENIPAIIPSKAIASPAANGPSIEPVCQAMLPQLVAFAKCLRGTISPNNENTDGPIKERIIPPQKTKK
ncbi:hypothetical protein D3C86_1992850 [compost metagenome]